MSLSQPSPSPGKPDLRLPRPKVPRATAHASVAPRALLLAILSTILPAFLPPFLSPALAAPAAPLQLFVAEPFLELRTGPGRGFPVTQIVARGESVDAMFRRGDFLKVRTERGVEGWAYAADLDKARLADGRFPSFHRGGLQGFKAHTGEVGVQGGEFGGSKLVSVFATWSLTGHLQFEASAAQFLGDRRDRYALDAGLGYVVWPERRWSPLLTFGGGLYRESDDPSSPGAQPGRSEGSLHAGIGLRLHLTQQLFVRGEIKERILLGDRDDNEDLTEWKLGLAFFY